MSVYGWYNWSKKIQNQSKLTISRTNEKEKLIGFGLFSLTLLVIYGIYKYFGIPILTENYFDILASGIFFTAMWFMANKKIENWTLWIVGNIIVIPLYAYRGLGILSLQYIIFTILAITAYLEWKKILK